MLTAFAFLVLLFAVAASVFVVIVLGGLPGKIARERNHVQAEAINICGWAGLLTGVFWLFALVWAFTKSRAAAPNISVNETSDQVSS